MLARSNDPAIFQEFRDTPGTRDPRTIAAYLATMRDFATWLAAQPAGTPFYQGWFPERALRGYMDSLQQAGLAQTFQIDLSRSLP